MLPIIAYGPASGPAPGPDPGPDPGPAPDSGPSDEKLDYDDATVKGEKDIYTILIFPPVEPVKLVLSPMANAPTPAVSRWVAGGSSGVKKR